MWLQTVFLELGSSQLPSERLRKAPILHRDEALLHEEQAEPVGGQGDEDGSGDELRDGEGGHLLQLVPPPGGGVAADQRHDAQHQHLAQLLHLLHHSPQDQRHHMRGNLHE